MFFIINLVASRVCHIFQLLLCDVIDCTGGSVL